MVRRYVRVESAVPNAAGRHPGVFAMLVGLRRSGRLTEADAATAGELVERSYALHDEPPASAFDTEPRAVSWFVDDPASIAPLLELAGDVVALLERYGIACRELRTAAPGRVTFEDAVQVVAVSPTAAEWPL